jgi:hypothetical protein
MSNYIYGWELRACKELQVMIFWFCENRAYSLYSFSQAVDTYYWQFNNQRHEEHPFSQTFGEVQVCIP